MPLDCLELETSISWVSSRWHYDKKQKKLYDEAMAFSNRVKAGIKEVAEKHNVSVETAEAIHKEIRSLYP